MVDAEITYYTSYEETISTNDVDTARDKLEDWIKVHVKKTLETGQLNKVTKALLENMQLHERCATVRATVTNQ